MDDDSDIEIMPPPTPPVPEVVDLEAEQTNDNIEELEEIEQLPDVRNDDMAPIPDTDGNVVEQYQGPYDQIRIWPRIRFHPMRNQPLRLTIQSPSWNASFERLPTIQSRTFPEPHQGLAEMARPPPPAISPMSSTTTSTGSSPNTSSDCICTPNEPEKVKKEESKYEPFFKPPKVPSCNNSPFALNRDQARQRQAKPVYGPIIGIRQSRVGSSSSKITKRIRASVLGELYNDTYI